MDASAVVTPPYVAGPFHLHPFRALRLDPVRIGDPASARLYARPYRNVEARLATWRARGDVTEDDHEALYVHEYTDSGLTVAGVVGALDISRRTPIAAESVVLPHEGVHPEQVRELADRMARMALNPAPILLVQDFPPAARQCVARIREQPPDHEFSDRGGQHHRIWALRDVRAIAELNHSWSRTPALVADGHHRYAAYLRLQAAGPGGPTDRGLAMIVDQHTAPLHLGAIHRTLRDTSFARLRTTAHTLACRWRDAPHGEAVAALHPGTVVVTDATSWASIQLPLPPGAAAVQFLHESFIPTLSDTPPAVRYHHTVDEALKHLRPGRDTAVLLPAPTLADVWNSVVSERLLPEKATSFQPKPHPGVFIRHLRV
ncbi:DUF1015 family protein [Nocardioides sp. DS6]|uniref:DUF1015 family protein n=1 Tax=Nocardioides eburneus TaxID=3231482 RepID=A0ABV3T3Q6_9ACTN